MRTPLLPSVEFTPIDPAYAGVLRRRSLIIIGVEAVVIAAITVLFFSERWAWALGLMGVLVAYHLISLSLSTRRTRAIGFREGPEDLQVCKGIMFRTVTTIPYGRMQEVNISDGPLLRRAGLADVTMTTASPGAEAKIPGVSAKQAEQLRARLTAMGTSMMEGL